jgi:hypothetical protein
MATTEEKNSNPLLDAAGSLAMTAAGGYTQAALGGLQAVYGLSQAGKSKRAYEAARAAAPSLETPSQFYENYKNAYDAELARMETDAIQSNLATSVQALQGAGGRALVGGLSGATRTAQDAQNRMLAQERQMRMQAGQQLAGAQERELGRKEQRSQQDIAYANQAYQAAVGNVAAGIGSLGEGLMYGFSATDWKKAGENLGKAGDAIGKASGAAGSKISQAGEFVKDKAIALKERAEYGMDMLPEKINEFQNQRAIKKQLRTAKVPTQQPVDTGSMAKGIDLNVNPFENYTPPTPQQPAPANALNPQTSSVIPQYQQNEAVLEGIRNDASLYKMVSPYLQGGKQLSPAQKGWMKWYDKFGSYIPMMENGGMVTKGEFNHSSNPIHLVQNGEKVGEATGGEYILNPKQAAAVAKESTYARKLFKQFSKKAKK